MPGTMMSARAGSRHGKRAALGDGQGAETLEQSLDGRALQRVALHAGAIVAAEAEVQRGERGHGAGRADDPAGPRRPDRRPAARAQAGRRPRRRAPGSRAQSTLRRERMALGEIDDAEAKADRRHRRPGPRQDVLGAPAADVEHQRASRPAARRGHAERRPASSAASSSPVTTRTRSPAARSSMATKSASVGGLAHRAGGDDGRRARRRRRGRARRTPRPPRVGSLQSAPTPRRPEAARPSPRRVTR